jgi:hypothetical protein
VLRPTSIAGIDQSLWIALVSFGKYTEGDKKFMKACHISTFAIDLRLHQTVKPEVSVTMAISRLEYPRLLLARSKPPLDGPAPYVGDNEGDNLDFFQEAASDEDWSR